MGIYTRLCGSFHEMEKIFRRLFLSDFARIIIML